VVIKLYLQNIHISGDTKKFENCWK